MRDLDDKFDPLPEGDEAFVLRPMSSRDLPQVIEIERESFSEPWSMTDFEREFLQCYASDLTVAVRGEKVLGYTVAWHLDDEVHLANVAVRSGYRERGIGRALIEGVIALAKRQGVGKVSLEVRESNLEARRLYETLGFHAVGVKRDYYRKEHEDAVLMRRLLTEREPRAGEAGDRRRPGDAPARPDSDDSPDADGEGGGAG